MPTIAEIGTTYNLPQFSGELFTVAQSDTPLLSAIGGLTGGESVGSPLFEWREADLRDAADDRQRLEGADAPTVSMNAQSGHYNVCEIHQETVSISYTRLGANRMHSVGEGQKIVWIDGVAVPASEFARQTQVQMSQIARDVEKTFITGVFQNPDDNTKPRKTRGLLDAIKTNVVASPSGGMQNVTTEHVLDMMQKVWEAGGLRSGETRTLIVGPSAKRRLSKIFLAENRREDSRNVGGVDVQTIMTDFGLCNVMLSAFVPADKIIAASLDVLRPAFLEIPNRGHFFLETLGVTGAALRAQIYGEIGLIYGHEKLHGVLTVTA